MSLRNPLPGSPLNGDTLAQALNSRFEALFNGGYFALSNVGGTADAVTADMPAGFTGGGFVAGMRFGLTWDDENTGPVTLAIGGATALDVVDQRGLALTAGMLSSGLRSILEYDGTDLRLMTTTAQPVAAVGAVGTYALCRTATMSTIREPGDILAGADLYYANADGTTGGSPVSPSGSWRLMGRIPTSSATAALNTAIWLRIA